MTTHFINGKIINQQNTELSYTRFMSVKDSADVCFTWNVSRSEIGRYNVSEIGEQIRLWITEGEHLFMKAYNNKTFNIHGKDWYACVLQKFTGADAKEMDEDDNPTDTFSMLMCSTWVNGYTYYFETEAMRDWCCDCINNRKFENRFVFVETIECCLCRKPCENKYGNNPYPLSAGGKCCNKCNGEVISARMKGVVRCEDLKDDEDKADLLMKCKKITEHKIQQKCIEYVGYHFTLNEDITLAIYTLVNICFKYLGERLERHIRVRTITDPEAITLTIDAIINTEFGSVLMPTLSAFKTAEEAKRLRIAEELAKEVGSVSSDENTVEARKEQKKTDEKSRTKGANKAQSDKKKQREEYARQVMEAEKALKAQEARNKQKAQQKKQQSKK